MCSICGFVNFSDSGSDAAELIRRMLATQIHRGPDGEGIYSDAAAALGHRRLSIIDPEGGAQPIYNEDRSIAMVCNGEIYNHAELRRMLEAKGHVFISRSDCECIPHLYEEFGVRFFTKLKGMFAVALYDTKKRKLILGRDRMGQKPLLYFRIGRELSFASEMSALKLHPRMPRLFDVDAVSQFMSLQYIAAPRTIYAGVHKLMAGCSLEFELDSGRLQMHRYWQLDYSAKSDMSFDEAAKELRERLTSAVGSQLMSDVPNGVFLSGGLDSTIVTALMTKLRLPEPTECFSVGFAEAAYDERRYVSIAGNAINAVNGNRLKVNMLQVDPCDFELLKKLVRHYGEPYADASMLPTYLMCRFAAGKVKVCLSGDGADELFGGYERYRLMAFAQRLSTLPPQLRKLLFSGLSRIFSDAGERTRSGRLKRAFAILSRPENAQYFSILDRCPLEMRKLLFGSAMRDAAAPEGYFSDAISGGTASGLIERYLELDVNTYLPNDILPKVDIASMANSLEVRSPFMDHELAEFAASLPMEYKLCGNSGKHILKHAFSDIVPEALRDRAKKGFGVPVASWLRGSWHDLAEKRLTCGVLPGSGLINGDGIRKIWELHQSGRQDCSYLLWNLLVLELFLSGE